MARRLWFQVSQNFSDIFAFSRERLSAIGILGVIAKEITVVFHVRAAAGGIVDNDVHFGALEGIDGSAGKIERLSFASGMDHQGATTALVGWDHYFAAFCRQHASGCPIHAREKDALHAS